MTKITLEDVIRKHGKKRSIPLELIHIDDTWIRDQTTYERKFYFAELYETGANLPPIVVAALKDGTYLLVDGRGREGGVAEFLTPKWTHMDAIVIPEYPKPVLKAFALQANATGSQPMTPKEKLALAVELINSGMTKKDFLRYWPYTEQANMRQYDRAIKSITSTKWAVAQHMRDNEGKSIAEIAEALGMDPLIVDKKLSRISPQNGNELYSKFKRDINAHGNGYRQFCTRTSKDVIESFGSNKIKDGHIRELFLLLDQWILKVQRNATEWKSKYYTKQAAKNAQYQTMQMPGAILIKKRTSNG